MYYVGCDQHKHYTLATAKDKEGNVMNHEKLNHNSRDRLTAYFASLPEGSSVLLEASGFDSWLVDLLQDMKLNVKLAHPLKTRAIAEQRIKTDKISSSVLADLLRTNLVAEAYIASPDIRHKRFKMRYRQSLVRMRTLVKNRIHSILSRLGLDMPSVTDLFGKTGRSYIEHLELELCYKNAVNEYLELIDTLNTMIARLEREIRKDSKTDPSIELLRTVPGIGLILSYVVNAEIGNIDRFLSSAKLASYTGIIPSLHQSGMKCYSGHITRHGNKYLRWAFVEAAHIAIRQDLYLKNVYLKIRAKKGSQVAIVAVAHKLLTYTYQVLKNKEAYKYKVIMGRA